MDPEALDKAKGYEPVEGRISSINSEDTLKELRKKYDALNQQVDSMINEIMERSNRIIMDAEIAHLIMNQVFNASNDGIWAIDKNYKVIRVNKKLLKILGKSIEEVIGNKCHDLFPGGGCDRANCPKDKVLSKKSIVERELSVKFASGKMVPFLLTATPLSGLDGSAIGLVETFTDITEIKHAEEVLQRANRELERLASQDGLTKLSNRRSFDESLESEWRRQMRDQKPLSLILCDVDFFKNYNDHYGHQAGDVCLRSVAEAIHQCVNRVGDVCARYGGEEFAVIMPATDANGAWHIAQNIRSKLSEMQIAHSQSTAAPYVTISCGIACLYPHHPESKLQKLIELADQALYRAKQQGRNCVIISDINTASIESA
jgi:diguanylate cyclase (GGDEF)-like protein/PAS domain S-box-containing protein